MKESGFIRKKGLTTSVFYKIVVACIVSLYDIILRVKHKKQCLYSNHGNPKFDPNDLRKKVHNMAIYHNSTA